MGTVSTPDCDHVKGLIAVDVIGRLSDHDRVGLVAHLDGCSECRADARELKGLRSVLPEADLEHLEPQDVPVGLYESVVGRLTFESHRERRNRRLRYAVSGAVAAGLVALGLGLGLTGGSQAQTRTVALAGTPGVHATVALKAESWGTAVRVEESGQPGGQVLWVWMRTKSGTWWEAGTYRSVADKPVDVQLACALELSQIDSIWVRDSSGRTVLHGYTD